MQGCRILNAIARCPTPITLRSRSHGKRRLPIEYNLLRANSACITHSNHKCYASGASVSAGCTLLVVSSVTRLLGFGFLGLDDTSMGLGAGFMRRRSLSISSSQKARDRPARIMGFKSGLLASFIINRCRTIALRYGSLYCT